MTAVVVSLMWSASLVLLFAVSHVRLQCDSGASFEAQCNNVGRRKLFLLYESAPTERIECSSMDPGNSYRWTRSPDGTELGSMDLDASSNKYTIDGRNLSITLSNITGEDGGLYRCVYSGNTITNELCIKVYERAVFESCPSEYDGCIGSTQLQVTVGERAVFDASITYTPGGSCDFQQELNTVMLWRINNQHGVNNDLLFSCGTAEGITCTINDPRVSWSRGNKPGLQFRFTLNSTQLADNSSYQVIVLGRHPQTGVETELIKNFYLQVNPAPTFATSFPATSTVESTTSESISNNNPVGASSSDNSGAVAAGILVPLLVVVLVVIVLGLLFSIVRWKQGSLLSPPYLYKSSGVRKDAVGVESDGMDSPSQANSITVTVSRTEVQPLGNVPNILINIEDSVAVSLPPENTRMSFIDSNMHELPSRLQDHEPLNLPPLDPNPEKTLESPGVPV